MTGGKGEILVVDDDPNALELLECILGDEGYQVQSVDSARLALISIASARPELILLDIRMPDMDCLELCRRLKESEDGRRIPVMFISATPDVQEWLQALEMGAVDFISKPFRWQELLARVRTHLKLGRLQNQLEARVEQRTAELRAAVEQLQLELADRRRVEQAVRESEERFRQIANAAPVIIWLADTAGMLTFCNNSALSFTGRKLEEIIGRRWVESIHPNDLHLFHSTYYPAIAARQPFQIEYRKRRADGEYRWVLDVGVPRLVDSVYQGHIGTITDITDIKRSQERLFAAQNLENLRVLTAGIAHDFNTLLGAILGETDLALSEMLPDAVGRANVDRISTIVMRAAEIVRLLMTYAGGPLYSTERELLSLSALVQEMTAVFKFFSSKGSEIRTHLATGLPSVLGNAAQIRQVIMNLVINALEAYDGQKGVVTLTTLAVQIGPESPNGSCEDLPEGRYVKLEITDTGRGMTEEVQARIFDPYYTTKSLGHGLGLGVVQGIIRSHGGTITMRSAPGEGSTFAVLLPVT